METEGLYALKQEQWNKEITEIEAGRINFAKAKIVLDQGDQLNQYGESRREQGLPELTNNEKFEFALKKEKQYLDTARDKTSEGYISKKNNYDSYINQTRRK